MWRRVPFIERDERIDRHLYETDRSSMAGLPLSTKRVAAFVLMARE
jgi:hypothetical protein